MGELPGITLTEPWATLGAAALIGWLAILLLMVAVWHVSRVPKAVRLVALTYLAISGGFGIWALQLLRLAAVRAGGVPLTVGDVLPDFVFFAFMWPWVLFMSWIMNP